MAKAVVNITLRSNLEPLLDILLRVPVNSPDWFTEGGSIPKKATSLLGLEKAEKSPTSASIVAAVKRPIPGMLQSKSIIGDNTGISFKESSKMISLTASSMLYELLVGFLPLKY